MNGTSLSQFLFVSGLRFNRPGCYDVTTDEVIVAWLHWERTGLNSLEHLDFIRMAPRPNSLATTREMEVYCDIIGARTPWPQSELSCSHHRYIAGTIAYQKRIAQYESRRALSKRYIAKSDVRERIFSRDSHSCCNCGISKDLTIDHICAVVNGGDDSDDNLQTLCRSCNSKKGAR